MTATSFRSPSRSLSGVIRSGDSWIPTLAAAPAVIVASIGFSVVGGGAATRGGAVAWFLWLGFVGFSLLQNAETGGVRTEV